MIRYAGGKLDESFIVADSVSSIKSGAFDHCGALTSITIPNSVTNLGGSVFNACKSLVNVELGLGITALNSAVTLNVFDIDLTGTFSNCFSLTSITIPTSVTSIGNYTFYNCTSLESIEIPDSVTSIGHSAFYGTALYKNEANWENGVLYINNRYLVDTKSELSGDYLVKEGTSVLASAAFSGCSALTSITIPESVIAIGPSAFMSCKSLTKIVLPSTPPTLEDTTAFPESSTDRVFYVPSAESLALYQADPIWSSLTGTFVVLQV